MIAENRPDVPRLAEDAGIGKGVSTSSSPRDDESLFAPVMDFRKLMAMIGAFYWLVMTVIVVPASCVATCYLLLVPIMLINMKFFNTLEHALCRMVNDHWVSAGQYTGLTLEEYGDDLTQVADKRALFLANHLGLIDHFCLMTAFYDKKSVTGKYLWVIYNIWKSTPLGVLWTAHGNFFINGGASKRAGVLAEFRNHLKNKFWRFDYGWVVMYPEGSRLYLIRNSEKKFAEKNGIEPFKHCAHPRTGAAHAVMDVLGPADSSLTVARASDGAPVEYIVDCTLGYPKGKVAGLGEAMLGEWPDDDSRVAIHYSIHKVTPELADESKLKDWLYKQYEKKDKLLDDYYRTGRFPGRGRPVHFSLARNVLVQLFWIVLFYAHYTVWTKPLTLWLLSLIF